MAFLRNCKAFFGGVIGVENGMQRGLYWANELLSWELSHALSWMPRIRVCSKRNVHISQVFPEEWVLRATEASLTE